MNETHLQEDRPTTVAEGLRFFKETVNFENESATTRRIYLRGTHVFGVFLLLGSNPGPAEIAQELVGEEILDAQLAPGRESAKNLRKRQKTRKRKQRTLQKDLEAYIQRVYFEGELYVEEPAGAERLEIRNDIRVLSLAALPPTVVPDFAAWMSKPDQTGERRFSEATALVYFSAVKRLLRLWRSRGLISFSEAEEKENIDASVIKRKKTSYRTKKFSQKVPERFREIMLEQAMSIPLPPADKDYPQLRLDRLNVLRTRAVIGTLASSALRVSDIVTLEKDTILPARSGQTFEVESKKTGRISEIYLHEDVLAVIDDYLDERGDISPFLFIQHGRAGTKVTPASVQAFRDERNRRGYGKRLSEHAIREIVKEIAILAGYRETDGSNPNNYYCSPHAFRHAYARSLRAIGVPIADIQDVLGHADPNTTTSTYAVQTNKPAIIGAGQRLQAMSPELKHIRDEEMKRDRGAL
ncbi:site-specific integrase [bacterium]|nr:site-specific integrase [bacterium]